MRKYGLIATVLGMLLAGCDRREQASSQTPGDAGVSQTARTDASPDTAPIPDTADAHVAGASTTPAAPAGASFMVTNGASYRLYDFPQARLRLVKEDDKYAAVLYSDDPKTAINADYSGNSFFLRMKLDLEDPRRLSNAEWRFRAVNSEHEESGDGIFLNGTRIHLQPFDVKVSFDGGGRTAQVVVEGQFLQFNSDDSRRLPAQVGVRGEFAALLDINKAEQSIRDFPDLHSD